MEYIWVLIPLAGILLGAFNEWLKFKEKQLRLGESTSELASTVDDLRSEQDRLVERIRNLEAIVTSQDWDALPEVAPPLHLEGDEPSDAERAARIARRVR